MRNYPLIFGNQKCSSVKQDKVPIRVSSLGPVSVSLPVRSDFLLCRNFSAAGPIFPRRVRRRRLAGSHLKGFELLQFGRLWQLASDNTRLWTRSSTLQSSFQPEKIPLAFLILCARTCQKDTLQWERRGRTGEKPMWE